MSLATMAMRMLRDDEDLTADARVGAPRGNSTVGSVIALTTGSPRWATEQAVCRALAALDAERGAT